MGAAMKRLCNKAGCGDFAIGGGYCPAHSYERGADGAGHAERHRMYGRSWRMRRQVYLAENPWCEDCLALEVYEGATELHHVVAHRGDADLFISGRLVGLCKRCHSRRTGRGE